jgi:putative cell wall-binding protein
MRTLRLLVTLLSGVAVVMGVTGATPTQAQEPAVVGDDFYVLTAGQELNVRGPGLLANDVASPTSIVTFGNDGPHHGGISWRVGMREGEFDYTPVPGYVGFDSFTYCLVSRQPSPCESDVATVIIRVGDPAVRRIAGDDRYAVAAEVSKQVRTLVNPRVFVASGENFPDALSAAPAARKVGGTLLLVSRTGVPEATRDEIARIRPSEIVVVGGPTAIPAGVADELGNIVPGTPVVRYTGNDRYAVSRLVADRVFGTARHVYLATGRNFPDALAAAAAAAGREEPVVLLDGAAADADAETQAALLGLSTSAVMLSGGPGALSSGVESSLRGISTVERAGGADRYGTSVALAASSVRTSTTAFLATGTAFPDALVGGVYAGQVKAPLYLSPGSCVPTAVLADLARVGASEIVLLGGERALSLEVAALKHC